MPTRHAFTFLDTMLVVAIIAILAAMAIPGYANASDQAKNANVLNQLRTIREQIGFYDIQHPDEPFDPVKTKGGGGKFKKIGGGGGKGKPVVTGAQCWVQLVEANYLTDSPVNPYTRSSVVDTVAGTGCGWVWGDPNGYGKTSIYAVNAKGALLDTDGDGAAD